MTVDYYNLCRACAHHTKQHDAARRCPRYFPATVFAELVKLPHSSAPPPPGSTFYPMDSQYEIRYPLIYEAAVKDAEDYLKSLASVKSITVSLPTTGRYSFGNALTGVYVDDPAAPPAPCVCSMRDLMSNGHASTCAWAKKG